MFSSQSLNENLLSLLFQGNYLKANLAKIQPENHQNVQKTHFLQKALGVNGLRNKTITNLNKKHTK